MYVCLVMTASWVLASWGTTWAPHPFPTPVAESRRERRTAGESQLVDSLSNHLFACINAERKRSGRNPLKSSPALRFLAQKHSKHMCLTSTFAHDSSKFPERWQRFSQRMSMVHLTSGAENIAYKTLGVDKRRWALEIVASWLKSPPHRANILNPQWRFLGIGVFLCRGKVGVVTQVFSDTPGNLPPMGRRLKLSFQAPVFEDPQRVVDGIPMTAYYTTNLDLGPR